MDQPAFVYILAGNQPDQVRPPVYVGSTVDLPRRVWEHRQGVGSKHTSKYRIHRLVWYEVHESVESAKVREHRVKRWLRSMKDEEITKFNPDWQDLYNDLA